MGHKSTGKSIPDFLFQEHQLVPAVPDQSVVVMVSEIQDIEEAGSSRICLFVNNCHTNPDPPPLQYWAALTKYAM